MRHSMKQPTIGVSEFVKRQTHESQYTDYRYSWDELAQKVLAQFRAGEYSPGYRDGVTIVHMKKEDALFFNTYEDFPMFEGMKLTAEYVKTEGREHEPAKVQVSIKEPKMPCFYVDVIIYRKDVLEEGGDGSTGAGWDIISINGRRTEDPKPMDPLTIVRNWKHLPGGTEMKGAKAEDVLEQLCQSIMAKNGIKEEEK